jgi:ABC-type transporter Mla subunit MlaD
MRRKKCADVASDYDFAYGVGDRIKTIVTVLIDGVEVETKSVTETTGFDFDENTRTIEISIETAQEAADTLNELGAALAESLKPFLKQISDVLNQIKKEQG